MWLLGDFKRDHLQTGEESYPAPDEFPHKGMFFDSSTYQLAKWNDKSN